MNTPASDESLLDMLSSLEEAIAHETVALHPGAAAPAVRPETVEVQSTPAAPEPPRPPRPVIQAARRVFPDPTPRPAGVGARAMGSTSAVLSRFKWGV